MFSASIWKNVGKPYLSLTKTPYLCFQTPPGPQNCTECVKLNLTKSRKELPKVPFGELVEQGVIPPGAVLTDFKGRYEAIVKIDGSVKINNLSGSIHQVGAKVQGLPSCNGWDFWHIKDKKTSLLLDEVRGHYRNKKLNLN